MPRRSLKTIAVVVIESVFILWLVLNTFVVSSFGFALVLAAIIVGSIQYFRIPPIRESRISDTVKNLFQIDEADPRKNTVFHKGGAGHAPANTLEAVKKAIELGVAGVELDISFSKDGVCVLFHGPGVDETTEGNGMIHHLTYEELQTLNTSHKDPNKDKYPVTRIPKLEDCVKECLVHDMLIFFDCKGDAAKTATVITDLFKKFPELYRLGVVCSFYPQIIYALRQIDSNIITALTIRNHVLETVGESLPRNKEFWKRVVSPVLDRILTWFHISVFWCITGNSLVLLERGAISPNFKSFWEQLGVRTVAWTVNCPLERQFLSRKHGIPVITDVLTTESLQEN